MSTDSDLGIDTWLVFYIWMAYYLLDTALIILALFNKSNNILISVCMGISSLILYLTLKNQEGTSLFLSYCFNNKYFLIWILSYILIVMINIYSYSSYNILKLFTFYPLAIVFGSPIVYLLEIFN